MLRRYTSAIERARAEYGPIEDMPWSYIAELDAFTIYHRVQEKHAPANGSFFEAVGHAIAGAAGTAVSNVLVYPLDLVVTRLQVQQKRTQAGSSIEDDTNYKGLQDAVYKIYSKEGGLPAFYAGITQDTFKSIVDSFLFFLFYNASWRIQHKRIKGQERSSLTNTINDIGIGMMAGAVTRAITAPIQQVITRKQTMAMASAAQAEDKRPHSLGREQSMTQILRGIYRNRGLQGFWSGYSATLLLTLNPSLTMSVDSSLRRLATRGSEPGPPFTFLLAAISKATASSVMYPVALAKTRAQATPTSTSQEQRSGKPASGSVLTLIPRIAQVDGVSALYVGLGGEVVKGFFSHGLTMLVKQRVHSFVIQFYFFVLKRLRKTKHS